MFSWVSTTVNQSMSPAVEVDDWFVKKTEYFNNLGQQLQNVLRVVKQINEKENQLMLLYYDLSVASTHVSSAEEGNDEGLKHHWSKLSDVGEQVRLLKQDAVADQELRFEEPIASFIRLIESAKDTLQNRLAALAEYQAAEKR